MSSQTDFAEASFSDPAILARPNAYYRWLREQAPVHHDARLGMYVVSRYADLEKVLFDTEAYSLEQGYHSQFGKGYKQELIAILEAEGGGYFPDVIMTDPPRHTRIRRLLEKAFTAHRVKQLEGRIAERVGAIIDSFADRGEADGVADFATPMTIGIMCEQLGLPQSDGPDIYRWTQAYAAQMGIMQSREEMRRYAREVCELQHYVIGQIRAREAAPREDMISDLIMADHEGLEPLDLAETVALTRALIVGGNETTAGALGQLLHLLATRPDIAERIRGALDDERLLVRFVEELMRIEPPVRGLSRVTTRAVELGGVTLPEGAHVLLLFASANDDEGMFPHARAFDMERGNVAKHLSFGAGIHRCVGLALARMEVKVAAREIVRRLDDIRLAVPREELRYLPLVSQLSFASLPLRFRRRCPA